MAGSIQTERLSSDVRFLDVSGDYADTMAAFHCNYYFFMAFFQKISEKQFDADACFVVKESTSMRLFIGLLLLTIASFMFKGSLPMAILIGIIGIGSLVASTKNQTIMEINRTGFYYYGNLVTNWNNFVSAEFVDEMPVLSGSSTGLSDKFSINLTYYKDGNPNCYARKIPLTNTQDKSEEEIMAAIRFYYRHNNLEK